jgi:hypothetical protein
MQQSKLCKRRVTMGWAKFRPVPVGLRTKKRGCGVAKLGHRPATPALRALPSRFFVQQLERETSVNRP